MLEVLEGSERIDVLSPERGDCIGGVKYFHVVKFVIGNASVPQHFIL